MSRKNVRFVLPIVCAAVFASQIASGKAPAQGGTVPAPSLAPANLKAATPLYFIANEGQMSAEALYCARTPGYTLWLTREGLVFDRVAKSDQGETIRTRSSLVFLGANGDREVVAADPSD
ncbi:MAG: hypothetical protein JW742_00800, partial [Candidatus Aminicenantes bacterium]|nr:hypothetical protein [Candidatus Aminicenantes bacterium]